MIFNVVFIVIFFHTITTSFSILFEENGKDLPNNFQRNDENLRRRKRPYYQSNPVPSGCHGNGRTFFNIDFNYQVNINCEVAGHGSDDKPDGHQPLFNRPSISSHKPHHHSKPGFGGHKPGSGGHKPGLGSHKPVFESQDEIESDETSSAGNHRPFGGNRPFINGFLGSSAVSSFTGLLPTPEDIGNGFGNGLSSFLQTVPQIGQSFQSLLPNFGNFASSFASTPVNQGAVPTGSVNPIDPVDPVDPDETIYSDEIRPVNQRQDEGIHSHRRKSQSGYRRPSRLLSALFDW